MIEKRVLTHEQESCTTPSRLTTIFTDEADTRGTVFVAPILSPTFMSIIERLVAQLDQWQVRRCEAVVRCSERAWSLLVWTYKWVKMGLYIL